MSVPTARVPSIAALRPVGRARRVAPSVRARPRGSSTTAVHRGTPTPVSAAIAAAWREDRQADGRG